MKGCVLTVPKDILVLVDFDPEIDSNPYRSLKLLLAEKHPDKNIIFWGFPKLSSTLEYNHPKNSPSLCLLEDIFITVHDHADKYIYIYHNKNHDEIIETIKKIQYYKINFFTKYFFTPIKLSDTKKSTDGKEYVFIDFELFNYSNPANIMAELLPCISGSQQIFVPLKKPAYTCNKCKTIITGINNKKIIVLKKEYLHKIEQDSFDFFIKNNILLKTI